MATKTIYILPLPSYPTDTQLYPAKFQLEVRLSNVAAIKHEGIDDVEKSFSQVEKLLWDWVNAHVLVLILP